MPAGKQIVSEPCFVNVSCLDLLDKGKQETKLTCATCSWSQIEVRPRNECTVVSVPGTPQNHIL